MRESAAKRDNSVYKGRIIPKEQTENHKIKMKIYWENISEERRKELGNKHCIAYKQQKGKLSQEELEKHKKVVGEKIRQGKKNRIITHEQYLKEHHAKSVLYYYNNKFIKEYACCKDAMDDSIFVGKIKKSIIYKKVRQSNTLEKYNLYQFVYKCDIKRFSNNFDELIIKTKEK